MGHRLVIDGAPQPQSVLTNVDTMDLQNASALKYIFSADSKHVAHFAGSPAADGRRGVFLDGKFVPVLSAFPPPERPELLARCNAPV